MQTSNDDPRKERDVDRVLLECLDESLKDLLGETVTRSTYDFLQRNFGLAREEVPRKPNRFVPALWYVFGKSGRTIEKVILQKIYSRLGIACIEKARYEFADDLEEARVAR